MAFIDSQSYYYKLPQSIYKLEENNNLWKMRQVNNDINNELQISMNQIEFLLVIDKMGGVNLDSLGELYNEPRLGRTDPDYRLALKTKIGLTSKGSIQEIIEKIVTIYGASSVEIEDGFPDNPASFFVFTDAEITVEEIEKMAAAGVKVGLYVILTFENGNGINTETGAQLYVLKG